MKVKELIEKLQKCDKELDVFAFASEMDWEIKHVTTATSNPAKSDKTLCVLLEVE